MHKNISYGGLGCALCVLMLAMSTYLPTLKAATLFAASALSFVVCIVSGCKTALIMYAASSALAFFICQSASPAIVISYIICFGNYPIAKYFLERGKIFISYGAKALLYVIYFVVTYSVFAFVLNLPLGYSPLILFVIGIFVFAFYDFLVGYFGRYLVYLLNKNHF